MLREFTLATTPQLHFGAGKLSMLPSAIKAFGTKVLLVTGARSFLDTSGGRTLLQRLPEEGISVLQYKIEKEPSPSVIDAAVAAFSDEEPRCVVAIGGGSVLDAGKAISAMLLIRAPVRNYLEGVGTIAHPGMKIPFIAVPTTAGTGSEATKNAVISETGEHGYKRSLRHNNFVPNLAIVDPLLAASCPPSVTASSGMDAFTQLLESYLSTAATPFTDALAYEGLKHISASLREACEDGSNLEARTGMALAAYLSGITLANAGLGTVHGFASPLGGYFEIPHGVICSALMSPVNELTVRRLRSEKTSPEALKKYAAAGKLFAGADYRPDDYYVDFLLHVIGNLTKDLRIPRLSSFGVTSADFEKIVKGTDNKNNPVALNHDNMLEILNQVI